MMPSFHAMTALSAVQWLLQWTHGCETLMMQQQLQQQHQHYQHQHYQQQQQQQQQHYRHSGVPPSARERQPPR